jgi:hypothetical protein
MELQTPQSVQINFNNKIITLHNVTIVKNPKIITIDASQYSNFLKGSPVKLNNAVSANIASASNLRKDQIATLDPTQKTVHFSQKPTSSIVYNQTPITQLPKLGSQLLRTFPVSISSNLIRNPMKLQTISVNKQTAAVIQTRTQPKPSTSNENDLQVQFKGQIKNAEAGDSRVISKQLNSQSIAGKAPLQPKTIIGLSNLSQSDDGPPVAKKQCRQLEFFCICCKDVFNDSNELVHHIKLKHHKSLENTLTNKDSEKVQNSAEIEERTLKKESPQEEEEMKDLTVDFEETQDTAFSNQERSETPESPEFEEHVPICKSVKKESIEETDFVEKPNEKEFEYEDYEYFSNIMEPICELSCEEDSNPEVQDDSEAMRLYREAMEVNYQLNGIKKRGRRKQRKPRPLVENTDSLNGILAGLLENSPIKIPPGPGRGRRKEINEKELEMDRSNGICLFSCNK